MTSKQVSDEISAKEQCIYKSQCGYCLNDTVMNKTFEHKGTPVLECVDKKYNVYEITCNYKAVE